MKASLELKNRRILKELQELDGNKTCADCHAKSPRWASWNLGVFLCIRCAGIHRSIGVHITKIKSTTLDSWTQEQIDTFISKGGNEKVNKVFESQLPTTFRRPSSDHDAEKFIRAKYEKRQFFGSESRQATSSPSSSSDNFDSGMNNSIYNSQEFEPRRTVHQNKSSQKPKHTVANTEPTPILLSIDSLLEEKPVPVAKAPLNDLDFLSESLSRSASPQSQLSSQTKVDILSLYGSSFVKSDNTSFNTGNVNKYNTNNYSLNNSNYTTKSQNHHPNNDILFSTMSETSNYNQTHSVTHGDDFTPFTQAVSSINTPAPNGFSQSNTMNYSQNGNLNYMNSSNVNGNGNTNSSYSSYNGFTNSKQSQANITNTNGKSGSNSSNINDDLFNFDNIQSSTSSSFSVGKLNYQQKPVKNSQYNYYSNTLQYIPPATTQLGE